MTQMKVKRICLAILKTYLCTVLTDSGSNTYSTADTMTTKPSRQLQTKPPPQIDPFGAQRLKVDKRPQCFSQVGACG